MATEEEAITVTPGQLVTLQADVMRGHGTFVEEGQLYSSLAGRVVQVNKLVTVVAHKSRYVGEVGDIVVGRVKQVQQNQWLVDINAAQDSRLRLSAIHLPGGIQRRKLESDELEIRRFFIEDELVSAEIQAVHVDGSTSLHTRNIKYGKLNGGILLKVAPGNIQRTKNHFYSAACGIDLIIGMNGLIWLGPHRPPFQAEDDQYVVPSLEFTMEEVRTLSLVRRVVLLLDALSLPIFGTFIDVIMQRLFSEPDGGLASGLTQLKDLCLAVYHSDVVSPRTKASHN